MKTNTKIAGTTFHPLPENEYVRVKKTYDFEELDDTFRHGGSSFSRKIPCADVDAVLIPEPNNRYDPEAVKVMVPLESGQAFHIGYLPKDSELKKMVKSVHTASIMIKNFAMKNPHYNPSWIITEVYGL